MRKKRLFFVAAITSIMFAVRLVVQAADVPLYKQVAEPIEPRVTDLLARMTLSEKVALLGGDGFKTKSNARLGIPALIMTDGPLGPSRRGKATNYSSMINLAATFDTELMRTVAENIGEETRDHGFNMLLAPMTAIARAPHGGRAFECFGEDPYLTSRMTVAYVKGVQSKKIATCTKVLATNNQEWNRFDVDVQVDERALREIYLPPFKAAVQEADTWSIMAAYNQFRGDYCCENKYLLTDVLKKEWGFSGVTVSDWGGARSTVKMALSGLDLEMPSGRHYGEKLLQAVKEGQVKEALVDDKVSRVLRVMFKAELFDDSTSDYRGPTDTPTRRDLALEVARASLVLLKNKERFLPLWKDSFKSLAVIGPNANVAQMCGGGSGGLRGYYGISPLLGIRNKVGDQIDVRYEPGLLEKKMDLPVAGPKSFRLPDGTQGIYAEYFNNRDLLGEPVLTRIEKQIDFDWGYGADHPEGGPGSPQPGIVNLEKWSARWTGKFVSSDSGLYEIGVKADNGIRVYLDGEKIIDSWTDSKPAKFKNAKFEFEEGREYDIQIEYYENVGSSRCILGMAPFHSHTVLADAVALAEESDVVILCVGLNKEMEGEATDRDELALPADQIQLIEEITKANKSTVIVLNNATPILMSEWIDRVPVILETFYPGQEGGNALADILFGSVSPSGRLPMTFPSRWEDSSAYGSYPGKKHVVHYSEGIFVGYRHFDKNNIEPLFPFGHGLSFTKFEYRDLEILPETISQGGTATVKINVRNTGENLGDEVVQLYVGDLQASVEREVRALKGFARVRLKPGENKTVTFTLNKSDLSFYSVQQRQWLAEPGAFEVAIGASSRDIRLTGKLVLQ